MTSLTGTSTLSRFFLRRERLALPLWLLAGLFIYYVQAVGIDVAYPTQGDLDRLAVSMESNAAMVAMAGPPRALDTVGGQVAFQSSAFGAIIAGLMSMFMIGRHTRADEETERAELVRAGVVGRRAAFAAATIVTVIANVLYGSVIAISLISYGLPAAGSIALGVGAACAGLFFMAAAQVAAQVTESTRTMYGLTGAVIGLAYVLRAIGDAGDGVLSWLSPIGWGQAMRAYDDEVWWPALLSLGVTALVSLFALRILDHRDVGAGVIPPKPGPARAGESMQGALGLAWRLQRGTLIGWASGLFLTGLAYGSIGNDVEDLMGDVDLTEMLGQDVGSLTDTFYAAAMVMLAIIGAAYAIASTLRLRAEEAAGRTEPLLSTSLPRQRWLASHAIIMLGGSIVVVGLAGAGTGLMYGLIAGDMSQLPRLFAASLVYVPAVWVLGGLTLALFGVSPRLAPIGWVGLAFCAVVLMFGATLQFPAWLMNLSPFEALPLVPAVDVDAASIVAVLAVAAAFVALGFLSFRRRDITSAG